MVKLKLQFQFFDTDAVIRAVDKGTIAALSKAGAFVRRTAKGLIRKRKGVAAHGQPPSSHVGTLKRLIFFGFDSGKRSVAIGPTAFGKAEAPGLLEFGGTAQRNGKSAKYAGNPFMKPALDANLKIIPSTFSNTVKR